jgi:hypothetical protein
VIRIDLPGFGLTGANPAADYSDEGAMGMLLVLMRSLGVAR